MVKSKYSIKQMQIKLYRDIFKDYSFENLHSIIKKICIKFNNKCNNIFKQLIINIFYTLTIAIPLNNVKINTINNFNNELKRHNITQDTITLPIKKHQIHDIKEFAILMQDHPFGTFTGAYLSTLLYDLLL